MIYEIMRNMQQIGIKPEILSVEAGPAMQEITMTPDFGIKGPDNAFRFKGLEKAAVSKHGNTALFLTKPYLFL